MKSLGLKISLIVTLLIAAMVTLVILIVDTKTDGLVTGLTGAEAKTANGAFAATLQSYQDEAHERAQMIASSPDVANAVLEGDTVALKEALTLFGTGMDIVTLVDANGIVLMRKHSEEKGDSQLKQKAIADALSGKSVGTIEKGATTSLSTRGSAPIKDSGGNIIGAVTCGHDLSDTKYIDEIKRTSNCEVTLFDEDTRMSTTLTDAKGERVVGTKASDAVIETVLKQKRDYNTRTELFGSQYDVYYTPLIIDGNVVGMLFAGVNIEETLVAEQKMLTWVITAAVLSGVAVVAFLFLFSMFAVSRPMKKIELFADKIKAGELGISSPSNSSIGVRSADEVGHTARSLEQAYQRLQGYIGEIVKQMEAFSQGDFSADNTYEFFGDFILIGNSIGNITDKLNVTMRKIQNSTVQVADGSKQIADGSQALAQGSTEQAASVEQLSASIAEIAEQTKTNAAMAEKAATLANTIKQNAEKGSAQMDALTGAVHEIDKANHSISKVIKSIEDIAFQTNILALNASVEAARAGQHGKGFAVVAEEVRNLATKSSEAAKDTGALIANSVQKAELGARIADETASSLAEIVAGINESSMIVTEIAKSSEEQSLGITQINKGIDQVAQVVQQNSATAEESAAASEEMSGQSIVLEELIAQFKLRDDGNTRLPSGNGMKNQIAMPGKSVYSDNGDFGKY